jgi:zinc transporter 2
MKQTSPSAKEVSKFNLYSSKKERQNSIHIKTENTHTLHNLQNLHQPSIEKNQKYNINLRAAMIHIIGDIIQSIGVIIAAIIVFYFPQFQIIDPLMTIIFSIIVMFTTFPIIKQCLLVIMQAVPAEYNLNEINNIVKGVKIIY